MLASFFIHRYIPYTSLYMVYNNCDLFSFADIDECSGDPCDSNATCNNTDGSYTCTCNTGYSGSGESCASKLTITLSNTCKHS